MSICVCTHRYIYIYLHTHTKSVTMLNTHPLNHCISICVFHKCNAHFTRMTVLLRVASEKTSSEKSENRPSLCIASFMPGSSTSPSLCIHVWFINKPLPLYSHLVHQQAPSLCIHAWFINKPLLLYSRLVHQQAPHSVWHYSPGSSTTGELPIYLFTAMMSLAK